MSTARLEVERHYWRTEAEKARALADELLAALQDLVARCDGAEGVRADGSNIQTMAAHAVLDRLSSEAPARRHGFECDCYECIETRRAL